MTAPESPDALLRRAATRFDGLENAATPGPWSREEYESDPGEWSTGTHLLARTSEDDMHRVADPLQEIGDMVKGADSALIVALRPMVRLLASTLRDAADDVATFGQHHADQAFARREYAEREYPHEMDAARAVLGEMGAELPSSTRAALLLDRDDETAASIVATALGEAEDWERIPSCDTADCDTCGARKGTCCQHCPYVVSGHPTAAVLGETDGGEPS